MLGFKCPQWKEYLLSSEHVGFDESDWVRLVLPEKRFLTALYKGLFKPFMSYGKWVELTYCLYSNKWNRKFTKEMFTTPIPKDGDVWTYDNKTGKIIAPDGRELPYLHFLFFKKTKYLETDKYWKNDFWKIDNDVLISSEINRDNLTTREVREVHYTPVFKQTFLPTTGNFTTQLEQPINSEQATTAVPQPKLPNTGERNEKLLTSLAIAVTSAVSSLYLIQRKQSKVKG